MLRDVFFVFCRAGVYLCLLCTAACGKIQESTPPETTVTAAAASSAAAQSVPSDESEPPSAEAATLAATDSATPLPSIACDGFSAEPLCLPEGYRLYASADIAGKPYHAAEGSLVLSVTDAAGVEKLILLDSESGEFLGEVSVDPRLHGVENGVVISSGIASYGHPLGIRVKSYGYLIVLTGGYIAVDHDFQPFRTVYFSELPWFDWEWTNLGGNTGDLYDVSEDFRYLTAFDNNQYLIDLEAGEAIFAQRSVFDRVIDLPGVGTLRIFCHALTAENVLWATAELNGAYGVFRYLPDKRDYAFWPMETGLRNPWDAVVLPLPAIWAQLPGEIAAFVRIDPTDRSSETVAAPPGLSFARLTDCIGDTLILTADSKKTFFFDPENGSLRSVPGKLISVSADCMAVAADGENLYLLTPET